MALTGPDWTAIKWIMKENNYTIKDMMKGPIVVFRNEDNAQVEWNILNIKEKYKARPRGKKKEKAA